MAAALSAGVLPSALSEMETLIAAGSLDRLKPEPRKKQPLVKATPLDESDEEAPVEQHEPGSAVASQLQPSSPEAFVQAMVKFMDGYHHKASSAKGSASALERALDGSGFHDTSLPSTRRNAAARKALRDALFTSPSEISAVIEGLMAEDLSASTPGVGAPALTSARGWLEHRSKVGPYASLVHTSWVDSLRAGSPEQARARLNIALLMVDQARVDKGNWLLAQELSLELPPPMASFRRRNEGCDVDRPRVFEVVGCTVGRSGAGEAEGRCRFYREAIKVGAWSSFLVWVRSVVSFDPLPIIPLCPGLTAMVLRAYGNFLYTSGAPIHLFRYTLVGAQRNILTLKGSLGPAWEILSRWEYLEPAVHRTPLPEALLRAFVVLSWLAGNRRWAGVTLLAFFGMARLGEILRCRRKHLVLESDLLVPSPAVFLCLEASKTATRGRPNLRIDDAAAMKLITLAFQHLQPEELLYPFSAGAFRSRWDRCSKAFGLFDVVKVTPGGLRGGGAVAAYRRGLPVSDIQWRMRLKHQHTLEYYLQEVAARSALTDASPDAKLRISYAAAIFEFLTSTSS